MCEHIEKKRKVTKDLSLNFAKEWIKQSHPVLEGIEFEQIPDPKVYLLYGRVQEGKTAAQIAAIHMSQLCGVSSVMLLLNRVGGIDQVSKRICEYNDQYIKASIEAGMDIFHGINYFSVDSKEKLSQSDRIRLRDILTGKNPGTIICIGNGNRIGVLHSVLSEIEEAGETSKFNLIIDEGDTAMKDEATSFSKVFVSLYDKAQRIITISATSFRLWFMEDNLYSHRILALPINKDYMGILDFSYKEISAKKIKVPTRVKNAMDTDTYFPLFLEEQSKREPFTFVNKVTGREDTHPIHFMYKSSDAFNKHHMDILDYISTHSVYGKKWGVIVYNGDGITFFHHELEDYVFIKGKCSKKNSKGYHHFSSITYSDALSFFQDLDTELCPRIITICGRLADRQISFVSNDYRWHLTGMYININHTRAGPDCTKITQIVRLCGVYPYDKGLIPMEVYARKKIIDDIINSYKIQHHIITRCLQYGEEGFINGLTLKEFVKRQEVGVRIVPTKRLVKDVFDDRMNVSHLSTVDNTSGMMDINPEVTPHSKAVGRYFILNEENIKGSMGKHILDKTFGWLIENDKVGTWVNRAEINNALLGLNSSKLQNMDQLNGNWNSILSTRNMMGKTDNENIEGFLYYKNGDLWIFRVNMG